MKKTIFALFTICLFVISCKKDKTDPVANTGEKPYSNTNDGSNWIYEVNTIDPATMDTTTVLDTTKVTGADTSINAKSYRVVSHTNGNLHTYYNVTGNDYYQFQVIAGLDTALEALYLKDNAAVGGTWNQAFSLDFGVGIPVPISLVYTITEKGVSRVVNGITYNDVITVKTDVSSSALPGAITSDIRNYYARNIGLIEADYKISVAPPVSLNVNTQTLLKYADPH